MKFQRFARKVTRLSGYLNLLTVIFAIILIVSALVYQYLVLIPSNYKDLAPDSQNNLVSFNYSYAYITQNGWASYFGAELGNGTWWNQLISPFYVLSILFATLNFVVTFFLVIVGISSKNSWILKAAFLSMFLPVIGLIATERAYNKTKPAFSKLTKNKSKAKSFEEVLNQKITQAKPGLKPTTSNQK